MFKKLSYFLCIAIVFISCTSNDPKPLNTSNYTDVINEEFTGDLAYEITSFVEKYWRVVGNSGFNESIYKVEEALVKAGYILEENATENDVLTYRIEKRPLKKPTWESVNAIVEFEGSKEEPLLSHATNRNMIALNSYSTPKEGFSAEVIHIKDFKNIANIDVKGKIVFAETSPYRIYKAAIVNGKAAGIMTYNNPDYLQPEKNVTSIQFRSIPHDSVNKPWAIAMSFAAKERLKKALEKGKVSLNVKVETKIYPSEELTIVADIKGNEKPKERLVFSAHVQEPGANDNATGVGVALEMASLTAKFIQQKQYQPKRSLTFLWGDEIVSTRRYVQEDSIRAKDIKWGISLDMVGEDTKKTGGTFLIEKMPDPSAIWTRGNDKHTEWGGSKMKLDQMKPHYLNDFLIDKFKAQGKRANWVVSTNPFEGGSDHVPFLRENIPSVLFWHFTDQFYHTDNDRIDKVSKTTLKNVGTTALIAAYTLLNADENTAKSILSNLEKAAVSRLNEELKQSKLAINKGDSLTTQIKIINAWKDWYQKSFTTTLDLVNDDNLINQEIESSKQLIDSISKDIIHKLQQKNEL
ncbi:peptidase M28 [Polaribacter reichenbachii]|uniref:Carboxypeptidase Q n=1 Tax=Polaribacter reichenbachii TaxID=996801 RepID=A0A1B8TYK9_9FLAO|nr:M28 family peptidase [Polaribacter reichenbachii]APZ45889.1 peptidase M28 [Polaribacter reichenbachii]AUC19751.1 peptidase M28 [Polaribacter reichenbachii]OBY64680.1 peptidase M28 [Polaribacter reichenbachii]